MDRVIGVWHHFAPRDGYTKFDNGVGSNPLDFFRCGKQFCPGSRLFYFLGRTLHSTRNLKSFGEYPREIAGSLDFEMRGLHNIADTFCIAQFEVVVKFVGSN